MEIELKGLQALKNSKNLLAFSYGIDSTALFFLLKNAEICFDLAMVDYNKREQSKLEVAAARELASKFGKKIFIKSANLPSANFQNLARNFRYEFFEEICTKFGYENLILAHQLDDKVEWFFMQLSRGAGLNEMIGVSEISYKNGIRIVRPLISTSKKSLLNFLNSQKIRYFVDESNFDKKYKRNRFRMDFVRHFLDEFESGIRTSFDLLNKDANLLKSEIYLVKNELFLVKNNQNFLRGIDLVCKNFGIVLSGATKNELKDKKSCVISGKIALGFRDDFVFLSPVSSAIMDKNFKEKCRKLLIPKQNRPYIFQAKISPDEILNLKQIWLF